MPCKEYLWQYVLQHLPAYCWVLGLGRWRALLLRLEINDTINNFPVLRQHTRQDVEQQEDLTQVLISLWMTGTRGGAVRGGVDGSSSSVTLLSMKSTCSASPLTAKSVETSLKIFSKCANKSTVSENVLAGKTENTDIHFFSTEDCLIRLITWKTLA